MRERWGTFSVGDHMGESPFVSDVLLFDRLVIPVPDPADSASAEFWKPFEPKRLSRCLDILGIKRDEADGLALTVPWSADKRERFKNRMSTAAALATQHRTPEQEYYVDPFEMTRRLIKEEFRPALPRGVSKAWTVAAYTSADAFREDASAASPERRQRIAALVSHRFLTPQGADPDQELLKRAVGLATTDEFRRKRAAFYSWQEDIIEEKISDEKAVEELEHLLEEYNEATRKAFKNTVARFAFTLIPIALTMSAALIAGAATGLIVGGAGGLVQMLRFWQFDRKPHIEDGDLDAAAMIHDARERLQLE